MLNRMQGVKGFVAVGLFGVFRINMKTFMDKIL